MDPIVKPKFRNYSVQCSWKVTDGNMRLALMAPSQKNCVRAAVLSPGQNLKNSADLVDKFIRRMINRHILAVPDPRNNRRVLTNEILKRSSELSARTTPIQITNLLVVSYPKSSELLMGRLIQALTVEINHLPE
jgi:hypothetical protein